MFRQRESNAVQQVAPEAKGSFHFQQIVPPEIPSLFSPFLVERSRSRPRPTPPRIPSNYPVLSEQPPIYRPSSTASCFSSTLFHPSISFLSSKFISRIFPLVRPKLRLLCAIYAVCTYVQGVVNLNDVKRFVTNKYRTHEYVSDAFPIENILHAQHR